MGDIKGLTKGDLEFLKSFLTRMLDLEVYEDVMA